MFLDMNPDFHMYFVLVVTCVAVFFFVREKVPLEVTSIGVITVLLLFGQLFPYPSLEDGNPLDAKAVLSGFSNPSLIAVMALLVIGQALIQTDAIRFATGVFGYARKRYAIFAIIGILVFVLLFSGFINNTPLVVIAIPIVQALAYTAGFSESRFMIPLSYAAILGGMTTLIGSSTNLLVSSSLVELGYAPLEFFSFIVPGAALAVVGFIYVLLVVPHLLPARSTMAKALIGDQKEFVAEFDITEDSKLIGAECEDGQFPALGKINMRMIQRGGHLILPPFEGYRIEAGDILIGSATRKTLTQILSKYPGFLLAEHEDELIANGGAEEDAPAPEGRILAEVMITPASRLLDMSMDHASFDKKYGVIVLGIQRRAKVVRRRLGRIRLEAGDVLLVAGRHSTINALRDNTDFIILSGSKRDLPVPGRAPLAGFIFFATIGLAALGILSIPAAAFAGAVAMIATKCINIRQAVRAMDRKIFLLVASMLALGTAMQATGGAQFIAENFLSLPFLDTPFIVLAAFFMLVAVTTNLLTNNACAILFTPIGIDLAHKLSQSEADLPQMIFLFAITVVFAANCSFASPIGYQTNLLVMGPGHYRFSDFIKAGVPLVLILWGVYMAVLRFYFGL